VPVDVSLEGAAEAHDALAARLERAAAGLLDAKGLAARELSLLLTDDASIREINLEWRGEDQATDVLSFPADEELPEDERGGGVSLIVAEALGPPPLGDVVISVETAARQAAELGQTTEEVAIFLLVHGFCHLLGHDHGEPDEARRMRAEEDALLARVAPGQARPPTPY